jgi:5'-nucleotidase
VEQQATRKMVWADGSAPMFRGVRSVPLTPKDRDLRGGSETGGGGLRGRPAGDGGSCGPGSLPLLGVGRSPMFRASMADRPLLLLSNDDGVFATGLRAMQRALEAIADVIVVAPAEEQSAKSHSLTFTRPLRHRVLDENVHSVDGTPADCIYIALFREGLLPRRPDLVVSGINHGHNLGTDTFYSGTVAAAREAALRGVPALAASHAPGGDYDDAARVVRSLVAKLLEAEPRPGVLLNVNLPQKLPGLGVRATRLGERIYPDGVLVRHDPRGREYYWLGSDSFMPQNQLIEGSDTEAIAKGYVSVTPLSLEMTQGEDLGMAAFVAAAELERETT